MVAFLYFQGVLQPRIQANVRFIGAPSGIDSAVEVT
jgi:hypothetical protein